MKKYKILLGLTTTAKSNWREKVEECKKLNIQEIALFPTMLGLKERRELYELLENSPVKRIPHVHLKTDMGKDEADYLVKKFRTKVFNIHPMLDAHKFTGDLGEHKPNIYVENTNVIPEDKELEKYGGLCIDFSHWQDMIRNDEKEVCEKMEKAIKKFPVGCSHISAIGSKIRRVHDEKFLNIFRDIYSKHTFEDLSEFDYIKDLKEYLPELISLELENSFEEQLKVKKYLENIISKN